MSTPNAVGGYVWKAEISRLKNNSLTARQSLRKIVDENTGPQTTAILLARAALALAEVDAATARLEEIAREQKQAGRV